MKLSQIMLSVSTGLNAVAASISSAIVVPSLRAASGIKARGLKQAFNEHTKDYERSISSLVVLRRLVERHEAKVRNANSARMQALSTHNAFLRERIL